MFSLRRISISNWYLIDAKDIDIEGEAALVGPTGAGKSSIQDAIQTVVTGANQNRLNLNASASGRSSRSVLEYCLGMTGDPSEGGKPLRNSCETILALVFRDDETDEPITVGVAMTARHGDSREDVLSRFVVPGYAFSIEHARRRSGKSTTIAPWAELAAEMRREHPRMEEFKTSAERFTSEMLSAMRGPGQVPNVRHFLRAFSNALAFKPIFDPTLFVRDFVLEPDPLDVDRVRNSISTWRELEGIIADVEAKLRRVGRISERFRTWGRARVRADAHRWRAAAADSRRAAHDVRSLRETLKARSSELAVERHVLSTRREWIRGWEEEIRSKQSLLASSSGEARLRQVEAEDALAERVGREAEQEWQRIRRALEDLSRLSVLSDFMRPGHTRAVDAARQALALAPEGKAAHEALKGRGERLQHLVEEARLADGWQGELDDAADKLSERLRGLQADLERAQDGLSRSKGGLLSRETMRLVAALESEGIEAVPLCDVVDVADTAWQYAAEALLGRGREAIIVPPEKLQRAFDVMWSDRNSYSGCTLVKTSATRSAGANVPKGSIVEALSTDNEHARAFLAVRIGAFRKAESEAELDRTDRGVMRNGKTSSGMGLSVQRDLRELLLGRGATEGALEALRERSRKLGDELLDTRNRMRLCREAARMVPTIVAALSSESGPFDLEHRIVANRRRREALLADRSTIERGDNATLRSELADLVSDRDAHAKELAEEVEPRIEELRQAVATATAKLDIAVGTLRTAVAQRRKAWAAMTSEAVASLFDIDRNLDEPRAQAVCARFREEVRREESERRDMRSWLSTYRNDSKAVADNADAEARREQLGALRDLTEYGANWNVSIPSVDGDTMPVGYAWAVTEFARLEGNELRGYREACANAAGEMRTMLREDLLARLSEKLGKVPDRLEAINALLTRHRFTGQTYAFTHTVDGRFARMHDLALKAAAGELTEEAFRSSMDEVEALIEGAEDAARLADYRQYFTFEIVMTDAAGGRTTLSTRAVKGSGGEAQVPFYIAIAASLASAYFPGHALGRPKGMGLVLFDEAFNKLDVPNTQALLKFFRDMGLQPLIAGPEDKRATFTEVVDTIVLVNKSLDGKSVYVDAEHPRRAARAALGDLNPDHRGVAGFKDAAE